MLCYSHPPMQDHPTVLNTDQARLVKAYDGRGPLDPDDTVDDEHLTSEATRLLLDGWDIRDEASK